MERKCKSCDYNNWRQCGVDFCMLPFCIYKLKQVNRLEQSRDENKCLRD